MVPGFNTDFKYRGETYHVQTEDNGVGNPVVVTLLYHKGAILASRRTSYRPLLEKPGFEKQLAELMKSQHKEIMRDLLAGAYDKNGGAPAVEGGSGEHPAVAAAAIAADPPQDPPAASAPAMAAARPAPTPAPAAAPPAAAPALSAAAPRSAPPAPTPTRASAPPADRRAPAAAPPFRQPPTATLDEAIMAYLQAHAAASAATAPS